jgi:hypothetical protein
MDFRMGRVYWQEFVNTLTDLLVLVQWFYNSLLCDSTRIFGTIRNSKCFGEEIWRGFLCLNFIKNTGLQNIFNFRFYLGSLALAILLFAD